MSQFHATHKLNGNVMMIENKSSFLFAIRNVTISLSYLEYEVRKEREREREKRLTQKRFMKNDYPIECGKLRRLR